MLLITLTYSEVFLLSTDVHSASHASSPSTTLQRSPSVLSGKSDADSASTVIASVTRGSNLSPLQLLEVGKYLLCYTPTFSCLTQASDLLWNVDNRDVKFNFFHRHNQGSFLIIE